MLIFAPAFLSGFVIWARSRAQEPLSRIEEGDDSAARKHFGSISVCVFIGWGHIIYISHYLILPFDLASIIVKSNLEKA